MTETVIARRLRRAREARSLTQDALGALAGIPRRGIAVNEIERGRVTEPKRARVEMLAAALAVPVEWLYGAGSERVPRKRKPVAVPANEAPTAPEAA